MPDLVLWRWVVLVVAAMLVGFSKTGINGVGSIAVAMFALVLPARASTGTLLPLLISADLIAIWVYRRHADWRLVRRLLPSIVVGILVGVAFVAWVDNHVMRVSIGGLLLILLATQMWSRRRPAGSGVAPTEHHLLSLAAGAATGFSTMVANAAGPVMTLYLLASGLAVIDLVGALAWLFFVVNLVKLPFSVALGLVHPGSVALDATLLPAMALGAGLGAVVIQRVSRAVFERYVFALVAISAVLLLV